MFSQASKTFSQQPCSCCREIEVLGQWWNLSGYFAVSGYFCPTCFGKVAHDSNRNPINPKQYNTVRGEMALRQSNSTPIGQLNRN